MKVRIQGNSIRFRLKQFEVETFGETGIVKEVLSFGPGVNDQMEFVLRKTEESSYSLEQKGTVIQINIPSSVARDWTTTELVGFGETIITAKKSAVNVLVEKDFKCIDRSDEDEVGSYPNPREAL
jgi:hypothetical protein